MKRFFALFCALALGISAWAIPLTVTWVDGKVELQKGSAWVALREGDVVDSASTLRLVNKSSILELANGKQKIVLSSAGTYILDSVIKASAAQGQKSTATVDKLAKLVGPAQAGQTATGGVRGDLIGDAVLRIDYDDGLNDTRLELQKAVDLNTQQKYKEAIDLFEKVKKDASTDSLILTAAMYGQACSYVALGSNARAIKLLREVKFTMATLPSTESLLLARLDLDSGAKSEGVAIIQAALAAGGLDQETVDIANGMLKEAGVTK